MNTIIGLKGRGNSGKSTTIRILYELLLQDGFQLISGNFKPSGGDFNSVFTKNGKIVGVTSSGDSYDLVHNNLKELISAKSNICVCACRTFDRVSPGTNAAIFEFTNYLNQFVKKTIDNIDKTQPDTNISDAKKLLSKVNDLIYS